MAETVLNYYKLASQPFGVAPDPRYLFLSGTHREALASVLHGVQSGRGFMALIAKPGMGKTTLLFHLLQALQFSARTVFIFQTQVGPCDLIRSILADLGIADQDADLVSMHSKINAELMEQSRLGKRFVLVIDEAQNLEAPALEVVRMLSNFETPREKLMQIVLAGQPELAEKLTSAHLVQLRQRISILAKLDQFNREETRQYIEHRLRVAGYRSGTPLFEDGAYALIFEHSSGIPRNISNLCFNAMSLGCATKRKTIGAKIIQEVLTDLDLRSLAMSGQAPIEQLVTKSRASAAMPQPVDGRKNRLALVIAAVGALILFGIIAAYFAGVTGHRGIGLWKPLMSERNASSGVLPSSKIASQSSAESSDAANLPVSVTEPSPEDHSDLNAQWVSISVDDTLYGLSIRILGRADSDFLKQICDLNPGLRDPNLIIVGQRIRIPALRNKSNTAHTAVGPFARDASPVSGGNNE